MWWGLGDGTMVPVEELKNGEARKVRAEMWKKRKEAGSEEEAGRATTQAGKDAAMSHKHGKSHSDAQGTTFGLGTNQLHCSIAKSSG